ncbi:putative ABC transport system permease protein [Ekhidna lutea]|uniref:Putative ABC transport system permease protein n=1 Tax=Ekhidna lutea TaxID=447679 RepID=A0A239J057_EKHLU|nr:ABC transporter permease [Ekhidna lutea]SNS99179.1 putative ABC transport system permease protein [Ekhidna lutea]
MKIFKLIIESFRFAWGALKQNLLRTTLSLLGVTIGIFAIIAVFTLVDSLERSIKDSLSFLDANNLDIRRFPYEFGPDIPWWEYIKRPYTNYEEYEFLKKNLKNAEGITIFAVTGGETVKYESSSYTDVSLFGIAHTHQDVYDVASDVAEGRYFTAAESYTAKNVAMIGHLIAEKLFPRGDAIGKELKIKGLKYIVIAVMEEEGEGIFGDTGNDESIFIPYQSFKKIYYSGRNRGVETLVSVKGSPEDFGLVELEAEITGLLRTKRGLKPKEKNDFSVNRQDAIMNIIGSTFDVIGIAGWAIGGFSILVGGFGIANIMFVSVRERTNIIGIQKSLGAKNFFILFQFLFEAIFLSLIGGGVGLLLVWLLSLLSLGTLDLVLTFGNVVLGLGVAGIIGVISGIVPALMAARLDPVIAIRTTG